MPKLGRMPCLANNQVSLLIDGQATFDAIFKAIEAAHDTVLIQFFIIHYDGIGRELKALLLRKAAEGVKIYVLFDSVGSHALPSAYIQSLREGGVNIRAFATRRGWFNRFQVNFRNHRKIVVVDGMLGFMGAITWATNTWAATPGYRPGATPMCRSAARCWPACRNPLPKTGTGRRASCRH